MVNVTIYSIHGSYGYRNPLHSLCLFQGPLWVPNVNDSPKWRPRQGTASPEAPTFRLSPQHGEEVVGTHIAIPRMQKAVDVRYVQPYVYIYIVRLTRFVSLSFWSTCFYWLGDRLKHDPKGSMDSTEKAWNSNQDVDLTWTYLGVSCNRGTPKSSIWIDQLLLDTPNSGNPHIWIMTSKNVVTHSANTWIVQSNVGDREIELGMTKHLMVNTRGCNQKQFSCFSFLQLAGTI